MIITAARHTVRVSYLFIGFAIILLALFTVTARVGLPLASAYKGHIETRVSDYLRSPVAIGDLSLRWEGFGPLLRATEVSVFETHERVVTLDEIVIDINLAKSLLRGIPIINELSLVGASLIIETEDDGQVRLHGMEAMRSVSAAADPASGQAPSDGVDVVAWLFNARKVGLLDTKLTVIDAKTSRQLTIENLNIRAENDGNLHQLRIDARLPGVLGGRLAAGIDLQGDPRKLSESEGNIYLYADAIDVQGLSHTLSLGTFTDHGVLPQIPVDALGSLEIWGEWKDGRFLSARGPLEFGTISNALSGERLFDSASAYLEFSVSDGLTEVVVTDVQAALGASVLSMEELRLGQTARSKSGPAASDSQVSGGATLPPRYDSLWDISASASDMPADALRRIATLALSMSHPESAQSLANSVVSGNIRNIVLSVSENTHVIDMSAEMDGLAFGGLVPLPSFGPVDGEIRLEDSTGQVTLLGRQMPLAWPIVSEQDLSVDSLQAAIDVDLRNLQRIMLNADIQLADNGIDTSTRLKATLAAGASPHLDVQSRFSASDITALKAWLPRKQLGVAASGWIDRAIRSGEATNGSLILFGKLSDFPFEQGDGAFQASININGASLAFLPDWPVVENVNGSLELNGLTLTGTAENSTLDQFRVSQTRLTINNLAAPVIELSTTASGEFQDVVNFGVTGPLRGFLEPAIGDLSGTGTTEMDLSLALSLYDQPKDTDSGPQALNWRPFSINGSLFLANNDVNFGRANLLLNNASGAVGFNKSGITINNLVGQVLGHDVRISGATEGQGEAASTRINIRGALEANDFLAHYGNPLDQFIRGASQWIATINAPHSGDRILAEGVTLDITSDLVGAELLLPVPFNKGTSSARTFSLSTAFRDPALDQFWTAQYGDELRARVRLVDQSLHALLIELGQAQRTDDSDALAGVSGIQLQGDVRQLAADAWIGTIARYIESLPTSQEIGVSEPILPVTVRLETDDLVLGRRSFGKAAFQANSDETYLNVVVSNEALRGSVRYPREHWRKDIDLLARVDLLDWSVIEALSEETEPALASTPSAGELDPRLLPPLEARVSSLVKDNVHIHDLVLRAQPNVSGLDITTLGFAYQTMRMVGQGSWYLRDPQNVSDALAGKHATRLNLVLQSDDFGTGLDEIGLGGILDDAQGSIEIKLGWPGPLYKPEIASLDGDINVDLRSGSIVPLEPGVGRMVGLFAFQALPRRLNLDFKDMTGAGLAFETIAGRIDIDNGVAQVPLLQLTGPIGVVDVVGTSDLNTQQFDQRVTVLPRVSAALPIIGAISGGASAGIGALVATGFLKALGVDFDRIGLRTYQLTGDWAQPSFAPVASDFLRRRQ